MLLIELDSPFVAAKFHNPGIPGVRAVSQFLRCFAPITLNGTCLISIAGEEYK